MTEEVSIDINKFLNHITRLRTVVANIDGYMKTTREFEKTNIEPFTEDLATMINAVKLLERYKQMLGTDINSLENVGEKIAEKDEEIAQKTG